LIIAVLKKIAKGKFVEKVEINTGKDEMGRSVSSFEKTREDFTSNIYRIQEIFGFYRKVN